MDIFDEMLAQSPKDRFIEIVKHANANAMGKAFDRFIAKVIALHELLEAKGLSEEDIENFILHNDALIQEQKNDVYIGLMADILGQEG